jgi:hypothetical protein
MRDRLRHRVRKPACTHVVDEQDGVVPAHGPAGVNHLLCAALHLRVAALHGREIEIRAACSRPKRGCRAAAEPDQERWSAEDHDAGAGHHGRLLDVAPADVAETPGDHDRLVITAHRRSTLDRYALLEAAEISRDPRPAELVVEGRRADRPFEHDVERGRDTVRTAQVLFPGLLETGDTQV